MINNLMNRQIKTLTNQGGRIFEAVVTVDGLTHDVVMTAVPDGIDPEQYMCERFGLQMSAPKPKPEPEIKTEKDDE